MRNITVLLLLSLFSFSFAQNGTNTVYEYTLTFSGGVQLVAESDREQFYGDFQAEPNSVHQVDAKSALLGAITIRGIGEKHIYATLSVGYSTLSRSSLFPMYTTTASGQMNRPFASVRTEHTVIPLSLLGGVLLRGEKGNAALRFALGPTFAFGSINETMSIPGYRPAHASINGNGIGFRSNAGIIFPLFHSINIAADVDYSFLWLTYHQNNNNYSGDRSFVYNGFGLRGGLEVDL